MSCALGVLGAIVVALYQPLGTEGFRLALGDDGTVWLSCTASVPVAPGGTLVAWDLKGTGADAATAHLSPVAPSSAVRAHLRLQTSDLVRWLLEAEKARERVSVALTAKLKDFKLEREYRILPGETLAQWQELVRLSGWKGKPARAVRLELPEGETKVDLRADQTLLAPIGARQTVPCTTVLRWQSNSDSDKARQVLVLKRELDSLLGRRFLPAGTAVVDEQGKELRIAVAGAQPGEPLELVLGDEDAVRVQRTKAATTQVNARSDVHRRLAAYDEKIEYEYVVMNASPEDVELQIWERPGRGWRVEDATHSWTRKDADTLIVEVAVPARSRQTVRVTVLRPNQTPR